MGWNYLSIPNLQGAIVEVWDWISNFIPYFFWACDYLSMLGLKLIRVSKIQYWKLVSTGSLNCLLPEGITEFVRLIGSSGIHKRQFHSKFSRNQSLNCVSTLHIQIALTMDQWVKRSHRIFIASIAHKSSLTNGAGPKEEIISSLVDK